MEAYANLATSDQLYDIHKTEPYFHPPCDHLRVQVFAQMPLIFLLLLSLPYSLFHYLGQRSQDLFACFRSLSIPYIQSAVVEHYFPLFEMALDSVILQ